MTVAVAMSGGVDSAVAAALLQRQGVPVVGFTLRIWEAPGDAPASGCCSIDAVADARRAAARLGIPHYVLDARSIFSETVMRPFAEAYRRGATPNPCIECNRHVKFGWFLEKARELGADRVATGHYAIIDREPGGRWRLRESVNRAKDQSYVLYCLSQDALAHTLLPLGGIADKAETRRIASELGMAVSAKPDSQDICFVGPDGYAEVLRGLSPDALEPGEIVDCSGALLGYHDGIGRFTVGQRRRLPPSASGPLYVVSIDAARRRVVVGPADRLLSDRCEVGSMNWVTVAEPDQPLAVSVRIRYNATVQAACISAPRSDGSVECRFSEPQRAVTPGQSAVFYRDGAVLGGGVIQPRQAGE